MKPHFEVPGGCAARGGPDPTGGNAHHGPSWAVYAAGEVVMAKRENERRKRQMAAGKLKPENGWAPLSDRVGQLKTESNDGDRTVHAKKTMLEFRADSEPWAQYTLEDGTVVRVRIMPALDNDARQRGRERRARHFVRTR